MDRSWFARITTRKNRKALFRANKEDLQKLLESRRMSDSESGIHRVMMHRNPRVRSNSDSNIGASSDERREIGQELMSSSSIDERESNRQEQRNNRSQNEENSRYKWKINTYRLRKEIIVQICLKA